MTWAQQEFQKTLYEVLTTDLNLMLLISGVFDSTAVPQGQSFPYVTIGENPFTDRSNHTTRGWRSEVTIHVWFQDPNRGRKAVQEIQKEIDRLLDQQNICIDGWNIINLRTSFVDIIVDADNVTLHGIQKFNLLIGEA